MSVLTAPITVATAAGMRSKPHSKYLPSMRWLIPFKAGAPSVTVIVAS